MAASICFWFTGSTARARASLKGGCSAFSTTMPCEATEVSSLMSGLLSSTGRKSGVTCSIMSTSPFISAAVAVLPSGM